jgi:cyclase
MIRPRIVPCLLIRNNGLVKTVNFSSYKYIGDPINAVRILNEKEVDELIVLDIDATVEGREPDYEMIEQVAAECRMPLCYGGGVKSSAQVARIIGLGVEKVALSSSIVQHPEVLNEASKQIGNQSVVAILDVKKTGRGTYEIWTHNGRNNSTMCPIKFAKRLTEIGIGEIVINSIDCDGVMSGYDLDLVDVVRKSISVPLTVLGGAGSLRDIGELIERYGVIGAAAGSLFVFKGKYRAVLINYPSRAEKDALIEENGGML